MRKKAKGFTLVEVAIVVAILGLLLAVALPNIFRARAASQAKTCIQNLWQIEQAKEQYSMGAHLAAGAPVTLSDLVPAYLTSFPVCPSGGAYSINTVDVNPTCSLGGAHTLAGTGVEDEMDVHHYDHDHTQHWEFDHTE